MRDYFVRNQTKKSTGKPATATKRDEYLMFLLDTSSLKQSSEIEMDQSELDTIFERESIIKDGTDSRSSHITSSSVCTDGRASSLDLETPQRRQNKQRAPSSDPTTELLYELISFRKPRLVDFLQQKIRPKDYLDHFFDSLASTMRSFAPISIAKLKLKMSQIVGEEEVFLTQKDQLNQFNCIQIYDENNQISTNLSIKTSLNASTNDQTVHNTNANNLPEEEVRNNNDSI
ncbi:hypothetical protein FF38_04039 [Lucilia cuprina]|uniref:BESS domain-containing protein n=1 Tax=Lucilia cuprina TaxID=7375 RepID=A0A0L0CGU2_LUCCU|nr:hypothetical protein FF38_04039 [Lucilia cuprina]